MAPPTPGPFEVRRIVAAHQDPEVLAAIAGALRAVGHAVYRTDDGLAATDLACVLDADYRVDLLIASTTALPALDGVALAHVARRRLPDLPILYVANSGRFSPELEQWLPADVRVLREPFTGGELLAAVQPLLTRPSRLPRGRQTEARA